MLFSNPSAAGLQQAHVDPNKVSLTALEHLKVRDCGLSREDCTFLIGLRFASRLSTLHVADDIADALLKTLARVKPPLENLHLGMCNFNDTHMAVLAQMPFLKELKRLTIDNSCYVFNSENVGYNNISANGYGNLFRSPSFQHLESLCIGDHRDFL